MTTTIEAIFENGVFQPLAPITGLQQGQRFRITVEIEEPQHPLLKHCGTISDEDTAEILRILEEEFGWVDPNDRK